MPVLGSNSDNILRTDTIIIDTIPPIVFINKVKINGKDTAALNYYELSHHQNNIEINISGFINNQSELQFKYILEGKDVNWNYSVDRKVYYSSLSPGNYTFKVFAMSDTPFAVPAGN